MKCLTPMVVRNSRWPKYSSDVTIQVPCGRCPECLVRRSEAWAFRLMQEWKDSFVSHFITLTYSDDQVPITGNGSYSLYKRDLQLFWKRLRKAHSEGSPKIRYYAVGEYGSRTARPHYHAVVFDADGTLFSSAWTAGNVDVGNVTLASVRYVCGYVHKGRIIPQFDGDERAPEFSAMSKGMGKRFLSSDMVKWYNVDPERLYCVIEGGKKIPMPRYYRERIFNEQTRFAQSGLMKRKEAIRRLQELNAFKKRSPGVDRSVYEREYMVSMLNRAAVREQRNRKKL